MWQAVRSYGLLRSTCHHSAPVSGTSSARQLVERSPSFAWAAECSSFSTDEAVARLWRARLGWLVAGRAGAALTSSRSSAIAAKWGRLGMRVRDDERAARVRPAWYILTILPSSHQ